MKRILISILLLSKSFFCNADELVITQKANGVSTLDHFQLTKIFTKKQFFWPTGQKIVVFIKPIDSLEHRLFVMDVLNMTPYRYKIAIEEILYTGSSTAPIEIATDDEMILRIKQTPNSIGYLNYTTLLANKDNNIISINIQ